VVLLGSGHVAYGLGAPRQAASYGSVPMATVIVVPVADEDGQRARVRASYADYLWGVAPEVKVAPYPSAGLSLADRPDVPHPVVTEVSERSPAALAGLAAEDRVVSVDGAAVPDKETFLRLLSGKSWGDHAAVVVERAGRSVPLDLSLARPVR
jgi:S1-C subfamily serine protease